MRHNLEEFFYIAFLWPAKPVKTMLLFFVAPKEF